MYDYECQTWTPFTMYYHVGNEVIFGAIVWAYGNDSSSIGGVMNLADNTSAESTIGVRNSSCDRMDHWACIDQNK